MSWRRTPVAWTFLALALLLAAVFGLGHALGLREYTTILAGTLPPDVDPGSAEAGAGMYLFAWFGWTVGVPVLVIAAALAAFLERRLDPLNDAPSDA